MDVATVLSYCQVVYCCQELFNSLSCGEKKRVMSLTNMDLGYQHLMLAEANPLLKLG